MGERARRGYEEAEREAFRALPFWTRVKAHILALLVTGGLAAILLLWALGPLWAETVVVKYRGPVDLTPFECSGELDSSVVKRVCYNAAHAYMLISLKGTWYLYCDIDAGTVRALLAAESKGRFYNSSIKDSGTGGRFSCRDKPVPEF